MVENAEVRERRYLSQKMPASAIYRIPQRRYNAILPRLIPLSQEEMFNCRRCGEACTALHFCKAKDRQCFCCRMYGHYSKFCNNKLSRKPAGLVPMDKPTRKSKSSRKQQRDRQRYIQFKERKAVCVIMPFYDTSDEDIQSNANKTTKTCHDIEELYEEIAWQKRENDNLFAEVLEIQEIKLRQRSNLQIVQQQIQTKIKLKLKMKQFRT